MLITAIYTFAFSCPIAAIALTYLICYYRNAASLCRATTNDPNPQADRADRCSDVADYLSPWAGVAWTITLILALSYALPAS